MSYYTWPRKTAACGRGARHSSSATSPERSRSPRYKCHTITRQKETSLVRAKAQLSFSNRRHIVHSPDRDRFGNGMAHFPRYGKHVGGIFIIGRISREQRFVDAPRPRLLESSEGRVRFHDNKDGCQPGQRPGRAVHRATFSTMFPRHIQPKTLCRHHTIVKMKAGTSKWRKWWSSKNKWPALAVNGHTG